MGTLLININQQINIINNEKQWMEIIVWLFGIN